MSETSPIVLGSSDEDEYIFPENSNRRPSGLRSRPMLQDRDGFLFGIPLLFNSRLSSLININHPSTSIGSPLPVGSNSGDDIHSVFRRRAKRRRQNRHLQTNTNTTPSISNTINLLDISESTTIDEPPSIIEIPGSTNIIATRKEKRKKISSSSNNQPLSTSVDKVSEGNVSMDNLNIMQELQKQLKCAICLEKITKLWSTKCGHIFCKPCIHQAVHHCGSCPLCKKSLQTDDIHPLYF